MGSINFLLDTHTLLWVFYRKDLLPINIVNVIENENIFVSSVSFWEIGIKFYKGNLDLLGRTPQDLKDLCLNEFSFQSLDLDINTTSSFYKLQVNYHRDPFDRMLIWQALKYNMTF